MNNTNNSNIQFCRLCLFSLNNFVLIKNNKDYDNFITSKISEFELSSTITCAMCLCSLNKINIELIYHKVNKSVDINTNKYFRLTTKFSPLFSIIHNYVKYKESLNLDNNNNSNLFPVGIEESLDNNTLRKVFKPVFANQLSKRFDINIIVNSNVELNIDFDFNDNAYLLFIESFSHVMCIKKLKDKYISDNKLSNFNHCMIDKSHISEVLKYTNKSLLIAIIEKHNLVSFFSKNLSINANIINDNIFLKGTYLKLSREIGQSPWTINNQKVCFSSVQDEIKKKLLEYFEADDVIMHAAGREDRDVRMLGTGRPLMLEIENPKKKGLYNMLNENFYMNNVINLINSNTDLVKIKDLSLSDKSRLTEIKNAEDSKVKTYTCVVYCSKIITKDDIVYLNSLSNVDIVQKTPIRVSHRRTLMDRKKIVYKINASIINSNFLVVDITASAGTYIKEFVNSDLKRTTPSLVSLLNCDCDILQLDVTGVEFD